MQSLNTIDGTVVERVQGAQRGFQRVKPWTQKNDFLNAKRGVWYFKKVIKDELNK